MALVSGGIKMNGVSRKLMTVKEAAALIDGLSEYRLRKMCLSGQVNCIKAGRKSLVTEEAVMFAIYRNSARMPDEQEAAEI